MDVVVLVVGVQEWEAFMTDVTEEAHGFDADAESARVPSSLARLVTDRMFPLVLKAVELHFRWEIVSVVGAEPVLKVACCASVRVCAPPPPPPPPPSLPSVIDD